MKRLVYGLAALALLLTAAGRARAEYIVTDLGTLGGGYTVPRDINDTGQVVGLSQTREGINKAALYSGGKLTDLGFPGIALGINNSGQVVGYAGGPEHYKNARAFLYSGGGVTYLGNPGVLSSAERINDAGQVIGWEDKQGTSRPYLYSGGKMTDLPTLGGSFGVVSGINVSGDIVGWSQTKEGQVRAVLYSGGKMIDVGAVLGLDIMSTAVGINASGQVLGLYTPGGGSSLGFLYSGGKITKLGTPEAPFFARDINDLGLVVGELHNRATLYRDGKVMDLNSLIPANSGWTLEWATAINNRGQIVGFGKNRHGESHGYLLTPVEVPEPGSLSLLGLGALGLAGYAWRRHRAARSA